MMATVKNVKATSDQPRVTTGELKSRAEVPNLQYRVEGIKSMNRSPSTRSYSRQDRG
jgi:hypothetical protein